MSGPHRFRAKIEAARGGGAVAQIPDELVQPLGGLKQMRMIGSLNGVPMRTSTMPYRGAFYVGRGESSRVSSIPIRDAVKPETRTALAKALAALRALG